MQYTRRTVISGLSGLMASPLLGAGSAHGAGVDKATMRAMTQDFITQQKIPGFSIAIARQGKMIFNEPFGFADQAKGLPVKRSSLFRIASVSKPITSVAIFSLIEAGKLSLADRVFGPGSIFGNTFGTKPLSAWLRAVTIDQLLTHTAGGWQNDETDPMFGFPGLSKKDLMNAVIDQRPLSNAPGTAYAYSNFGYFVLGRVIEKVSGKRYDTFVKQSILAPVGVSDMVIASNGAQSLAKNEVICYAQNEVTPYAFDIARMDSHGGWIASASDLVLFMLHCDGFKSIPDDLKQKTVTTMVTPSAVNPYYARGWSVNAYNNWWHTGSLPGTTSLLVRASNGFCWAALANTRDPFGDTGLAMDKFVWQLLEQTHLI